MENNKKDISKVGPVTNTIAVIAFVIQSIFVVFNVLIQKKPESATNTMYNDFVAIAFFCSALVVVLFVILYNFNFEFLKNKNLNYLFCLVSLLGTYIHFWQLFTHKGFALLSFVLIIFDLYVFYKISRNLMQKHDLPIP